jgi:hypothetical protein
MVAKAVAIQPNLVPISSMAMEADGGIDHLHNTTASHKGFLPRFDLSAFDGTKLTEWFENCHFYFEYYQIPEKYKVQISAMNFSRDAEE